MYGTPREERRIVYRPSTNDGLRDARFPRAVASEGYERYARAAWKQAHRWLERHRPRVTRYDLNAGEARTMLYDLASVDLARRLYPQEELLVSELLRELAPTLETRAARGDRADAAR